MPDRPQNEEEFQELQAVGVIRASRFVRSFAKTKSAITGAVILEIHRTIFSEAWPEIAGAFRKENVVISDSIHHPPHHTAVPLLFEQFSNSLSERLQVLEKLSSTGDPVTIQYRFNAIIEVAAWLHHSIVHIHLFREGNGRTARLAANLILERYGLLGISIKIERENKNKYRLALAQIDQYNDYIPLVQMIRDGIIERFEAVERYSAARIDLTE